VNETTTTALILLGAVLAGMLVATGIAVERGDMPWPPGEEERVEPQRAPIYLHSSTRPTFSNRHPTLKTDHDEEEAEQGSGPALLLPPLDAFGVGLSLVGLVWLLVEAFTLGAGWGFAVLLANLFGGVAFLFAYPRRAWRPLSVLVVGYVAWIWAATGPA
jgi:hypothetical protein